MKTSIIETGRAIETRDGMAIVLIEQGRSSEGCGMGKLDLCKPGGAGMRFSVENGIGAVEGDRVRLGLEQKTQMKGYFLVYILPLLVLVLGAIAGYVISETSGFHGLEVPVEPSQGFIPTMSFNLSR